MRKTAMLLVFSMLFSLFSCGFVFAEPADRMYEELVKQKIAQITEGLGMSEATVDGYLASYGEDQDFVYDLIYYQKYLEHHPNRSVSFDAFRIAEPVQKEEAEPEPQMQVQAASVDGPEELAGMVPEKEVRDTRRYSAVNTAERIDHTSGKLLYQETDLHLPGVNGLDLNLVSRFNQAETVKNKGFVVPGDIHDSPEGATYEWLTHLGEYMSVSEGLYGIGAGWEFAFSNIQYAGYDEYYIRLADGGIVKAEYNSQTGTFKIIERDTDDVKLEKIGSNQYLLTYKDGKKDYFDRWGNITRTEDRYGNKIEYFYTSDRQLCKIVDSAGRNITFERPDETTVEVRVDGVQQCVYRLVSYYGNRKMLREKTIQNKQRTYFYNEHEVEIHMPTTSNTEMSEMMSLSETVYCPEGHTTQYTYEIANECIENENTSIGHRGYPRVTSRRDVGCWLGDIANEIQYTYESLQQGFKSIEEVVQTGVKTERISGANKLITSQKRTVPDNSITIETNYTYNNRNLLASYTQRISNGIAERMRSETYDIDEKGNMISHTDVMGNTKTYQYDPVTNVLIQMTEPVQVNGQDTTRYTINTLDEKGNVTLSQICIGSPETVLQSVASTYDSCGNVTSRKSQPEYLAAEYFEYTPDNAQVSKYRKGSGFTAYTYDGLGRVVSETDAFGRQTQYQYNKNNQLTEVTNPDASSRKNLYAADSSWIFQCNIMFDEKGPQQKICYDCFGRITVESDIPVPESEYQYDDSQFDDTYLPEDIFSTIMFEPPWNNKKTRNYDSIGRVISSTDGNGKKQYQYDYFDRVVKIINPDATEVQIRYDDLEQTRTTIDEEGRTTVEYFDDLGRQTAQKIFPEPDMPCTSTTVYDCSGQIVSTTDYNGNTTAYAYDGLGRWTAVTNALGEQSSVQYAPDGSYMTEYYPDGSVRQSTHYDEEGRVKSITDEYANGLSYTYDAAGNLVSATDRNGQTTTYEYNSRNWLVRQSTQGCSDTYTYDSAGKVQSVTRSETINGIENNSEVSYRYCVNGLVQAETAAKFGTGETTTVETEYDAVNVPVKFSFSESDVTGKTVANEYTRDNRSRITGIQQAQDDGQTAAYWYCKNGLLKEELLPNGNTNSYCYDGANRMVEMNRFDSNGTLVLQYTFEYDANGNQTICRQRDETGKETETRYEYDELNRLKKEINGQSGNTIEYAFDSKNNVTQKAVSGQENDTQRYTYMPEETTGNRTNRRIEITRETEQGEESSVCYTQDANGNTVKKIESADGEIVAETTYSYNAKDKLTKAETEDRQSGRHTKTAFYYDAQNRRKAKVTETYEGERQTEGKTTEYYWYGDQVRYERITEQIPEEKSPQEVVNLWGVRGLVSRGSKTYMMDGHGSVEAIYSGAEKMRTYEYEAYGNEVNPQADDDNPYRYCCENYDEETGLIYLRNRYYDPELGRFLTEDPSKDGANWYVYCGNNPVMFSDRTGLEAIAISGSEYDNGRYKYNFIEPAIKKIIEYKSTVGDEQVTWLVSSTGYSADAINKFQEVADYFGITLVTFANKGELQNYLNSKSTSQWELSTSRTGDQITRLAFFSHGVPGSVELGYNQSNRSDLSLDANWIGGIFSAAFNNPNSAFYSCNTGTNGDDSFAQNWVNMAGGRTWAVANNTTWYGNMNDGESWQDKLDRWRVGFNPYGSRHYPVASGNGGFTNFYRK